MSGSAPQKREGIPLGRILGVPVTLAYSWFLVAGFVLLAFGPQVAGNFPELGLGAYAVALLYAVLLLLSVLVHELAHALTAKGFGWPSSRIVLNLWGGHTQFENFTATPGKALLVALAGPAANFALAGLGQLGHVFVNDGSVGSLLITILVWANFLVAVFNVLPGLPLDGGRLVESAVWKITGSQEKGTVAAGWAGRVIVVLLVLGVIGLPLAAGRQPELQLVVITVLVAGFLWVGASAAINHAQMRLRLPRISAGALQQPAISLPSGSSVAQVRAARQDARTPQAQVQAQIQPPGPVPGPAAPAVILTGPNGRPEAVVDLGALATVPEHLAAATPASAIARALAPGAYVPTAAAGQELIQYLAKLTGSEYAVIDVDGRVTGLLLQSAVVSVITGKARP